MRAVTREKTKHMLKSWKVNRSECDTGERKKMSQYHSCKMPYTCEIGLAFMVQ